MKAEFKQSIVCEVSRYFTLMTRYLWVKLDKCFLNERMLSFLEILAGQSGAMKCLAGYDLRWL